MEAGFVMVILMIIIGLTVLGLVVYNNASKSKKAQGILNVDCSDPIDGPYLFLELKVPLIDVVNRKQVIFDVHIKNYLSHE